MFSKTMLFTTFFMLFACLSKLAVATPPACVLACVNEQPEVQDYEAICGDAVEEFATCVQKSCDDPTSAMEHYVSVCEDAGIDVVLPTSTPSAKPTKSSTSTTSETASSTSSNSTSTETGAAETNAADDDDEGSASPKVVINSMLGLVALLAGVIAL